MILPLRPIALALLLAACAGTRTSASPEPDRLQARRMLVETAAAGPVPLAIQGDPAPLGRGEVPALAAQGIVGLRPTFAEAGAGVPLRLVLWFDPPPGGSARAACAGGEAASARAGRPRLLAAWCEGAFAVAETLGSAADGSAPAVRRLVWESTRRLFPDDYAERYGFNLFGWRVRLGAAASF